MNLLADETGTAFTEAIIVIPVLVVMWMGIDALVRLYDARITAESDAAEVVLSMAARGECNEGLGAFAPGTPTVDAREGDLLTRLGGSHPLCLAHARATSDVAVDSVPQRLRPDDGRVSATRTMMCNTRPMEGLSDLIVANVRSLLGL